MTIAEIKEANGLTATTAQRGPEPAHPGGHGHAHADPHADADAHADARSAPPGAGPALAPPDGASFDGAEKVILLTWASVGILDEDEWYVVRLRAAGHRSPSSPPPVWTKATSWRVPAELYVAGAGRAAAVPLAGVIMRQTGEAEDGTWLGEQISPASEARTFSWQ